MRLYEIDDQIRHVLESTDEDGCLPAWAEEALDSLTSQRETVIDSALAFSRELELEADALKAEADRLAALRKVRLTRMDRIRDYVLQSLLNADINRMDTAKFKVWLQVKPPSVVSLPEDISGFPVQYLRIKPPEVDKAALLADWRSGRPMPDGVTIASEGKTLRFK